MTDHYERAAEHAGQKNLAGRAEAYSALAIDSARLGVAGSDDALIAQAKTAANRTLDSVRPMAGDLPWESVAHAALAVAAQTEGNAAEAAEEARIALAIDGDTHVLAYLNVLWAAGRTLIVQGEPETDALVEEVFGGFMYAHMSISDPEIKAMWFGFPAHRELAEIVGFEAPESWQESEVDGVDLSDDDLGLLRELASGFAGARRSTGNTHIADDENTEALLAKLGVESVTEAMEFAIKAGVTWQ